MPATLPHIDINHIPADDFQGVGRVAVAWSYLEGAVERIAWVCSGITEDQGICFTTHAGVKNRYNSSLALLNHELPGAAPTLALKALDNEINQLYGRRNEIVHSRVHYLPGTSPSLRRVYKARGSIKSETLPIDPAEYEAVTNEIIAATNKVMDIMNDAISLFTQKRGAPPPWPDRP
ncbi:MAG: hypothetical protein RIM84_21445 [Alphaproteobacteria bacterium]